MVEKTTTMQERLKKLRKEKDWTLAQMGDAIGASRQTVSNFEHGKRIPNISQIIKISNIFDVTTDYILGLSEERKADAFEKECIHAGLSKETLEYLHKMKVEKSEYIFSKRKQKILESKFNVLNTIIKTAELDDVLVEYYLFTEMKKNFLKSYDEAIKKCNYFFDHSSKNKKEYYELKKHMEEQAKSLSTLRGQYHLVMVSFSDFVMSQPNNTKNLSQLTAEFDELFQRVRSYEKKYKNPGAWFDETTLQDI